MGIATDPLFSDDYAVDASSLGAAYTVQCANGTATTFIAAGGRAQLASGGDSSFYSFAKIGPALFGGPNYRVKTAIAEGTVGANIGAMVRLTTVGNVPSCYFVGKFGAGACIRRFKAGAITDLVDFEYVVSWDGATGLFYLQLEVEDDVDGNVVLRVLSSTSENGTYTQRATYTDSSADKIVGAGTAALAIGTNYNAGNLKTWEYFRVNGTGVGMSGAAADVATASAALTTQVKLAAAASNRVNSSAVLTTAIKLAAAAVDSASASGGLSGGALLTAAALNVAASVAALTTGIRLGGAAVDTAIASGALTDWEAVTLAGTLYTGAGGALDPNFWVDSVPQLGTTLYYDATHITIYPNGEISSDVNNCVAAVQFFDGVSWAFGLIVCTPFMVGYANDSSSMAAQLSTGIRLAAAAEALATATAAFSTGAGLSADAADVAGATGSLSTAIPLSALATAVATAAGALTAQIKLRADAVAQSHATGSINGVAALYAVASAISTAAGDLSTGILLDADAADTASMAASLATHIKLSGAAADVVSVAAALSTAITLAANAHSSALANADLSAFRPLVAAAVDSVTALAMLSTGIVLKANATAISHATADLTAAIALLASASGVSSASATLTDVIETPPIGVYASDPRFYIAASRWSFFGDERTAEFGRKYAAEKAVLTFDFSGVLGDEEHLMGPITLMISATSGTDGDARSLFDSYPAYDMTQHKILLPVKGGLSGRDYYLQVSAATNNVHKTVTLSGLLPVRG